MFQLKTLSVAIAVVTLAACQNMPMQSTQAMRPSQAMPAAVAPVSNAIGLRSTTNDYLTNPGATTDLPPAKVGECFARVVTPATFEDRSERVLKRAGSSNVTVVPATFAEGEEQVMVRPAGKRLELVPATYTTADERVLVRAASTRLETMPATYKTVTERKLVKPAYTVWKRSSELTAAERALQNIDPNAGDILCLVEVAAEYTTVSSQVIDQAASTRSVEVPAEYAMVKKTVLATPEMTREVAVPAEFQTVKVNKLASPAREIRTDVPAEFETVTNRVLKTQGTSEWRQILCQTNATPAKLGEIQAALTKAGYATGRTDGQIDTGTMAAVRQYQVAKNLPVDGDRYINVATVRALGVAEK